MHIYKFKTLSRASGPHSAHVANIDDKWHLRMESPDSQKRLIQLEGLEAKVTWKLKQDFEFEGCSLHTI